MYRLHWKLQQPNNTSLLNSHHRQHSVPNKEGSHSTSADTQSCLRLQGCQEEHLCARQHTKLALFLLFLSCPFCFLLFYFLDNTLDDCLVRKWSFIPLFIPFIYLFVCFTRQSYNYICHLLSSSNPENTVKFIFWFHLSLDLWSLEEC